VVPIVLFTNYWLLVTISPSHDTIVPNIRIYEPKITGMTNFSQESAPLETAAQKRLAFFQHRNTRTTLAVVAVLVLVGWLLNTPAGLMGKADAVGYALCHQIPERSFKINGEPIALCARCTGMYVGAMLAILYQMLLGKRRGGLPDKKHLFVLGAFFLAFAVDGTNSALALFLGHGPLYEPSNNLRLFTGMGMGLVMASMLLPTFHQTVWDRYDPRPYFQGWGSFLGMVGMGLAAALLILTEKVWVLLPLTYVGVAGIIVLLVMLYSMILLIIFGGENRINRLLQLTPWLLGGFIIAFLHIGSFDFVRYLLTGTWEGFHIP